MHPDHAATSSSTSPVRKFLRERPWVWIVLAYTIFVGLTVSFVVIAVKNKESEVPIPSHGR